MIKPIVRFVGSPEFYPVGGGDEFARVYSLDHPRLGANTVRTSLVVKKNPDGSFETLNTLYVPVNKENNDTID